MYNIEKSEREITVEEYIKDYVNVEEFLECCKECPNYSTVWSCPPYDFDPKEYWKKFSTLKVIARKINFDQEQIGDDTEKMKALLEEVKGQMSDELYKMEKQYEGSTSLSAGSCSLCAKEGCTRPQGSPCRHPEEMRYSIESIGGNVGLTVSKLMGIELEWVENGKMPSYFVLVGGLLKK